MYAALAQLVRPYPLILLALLAIAIWANWRRRMDRLPAALLLALLTLLYVCSTDLARQVAFWTLEWRYPPAPVAVQPADTIVVLSGSLLADRSNPERAWVGPDTLYRCLHAAGLYRQAGRCRIIVSGGQTNWSSPGPTLAAAMRDFLTDNGVDPGDIVLEERSSNTYENVRYSADLLPRESAGKVLLVTHPDHMHRAVLCFRAQSIDVVPAPCSLYYHQPALTLHALLPAVDNLRGVERAAHEWLGILWYRLRGWI